ncbi:glycosyltransferase, partial [bacterium]|nr:glycosyltransferase [bacterium]
MKVALITFHSFFQEGGVKRHILSLHKEFKKRGIKTKIIVPKRKRSENYGPDVLFLGKSFPVNFAGTQGDFCVSFNPLTIEKTLRKEKFDILHFHNFVLPLADQILERSKSLNILTFHANLEKSKFLKRSFELFSPLLLQKINGILTVAPFQLKYFKKFKCPKKVIPNGIDLE